MGVSLNGGRISLFHGFSLTAVFIAVKEVFQAIKAISPKYWGGKGNIEISFFFKSNDALITIRGCITDSLNAILSVLNDVFKCSIVQQLRVSSRHRHLKNKSTH